MTTSDIPQTDLDDLAKSMGMDNSSYLIENPGQSIPLYHEITGPKGYRKILSSSARLLYDLLFQSKVLKGLAGQKVSAHWYKLPSVPTLKVRPSEDYLIALEHLLHSIAHVLSQPSRGKNEKLYYVAVPMNLNKYAKGKQLGHISGSAMRDMVSALYSFRQDGSDKLWMALAPKHFNSTTGEGRSSRIVPLPPFADWITQQGLVFFPHPNGTSSSPQRLHEGGGLLRLKSDSGKKDDPAQPLERLLQGDEVILPKLNELLSKQKLKVALPSYKLYEDEWSCSRHVTAIRSGGDKFIYRQFKGQDGVGGRLYGHWVQGLPKLARQHLTIDGRPTVELDYASMQLRLLYALKGVPLPDMNDLYTDPAFEPNSDEDRAYHRDQMKMVLVRSVGNSNRANTIASLNKEARESGKKHNPEKAERLYDAFWSLHQGVCPHTKGEADAAWKVLQYIDSNIALRVLSKLMDLKITAIPIHDSFIVQDRYADALDAAMKEAFDEVSAGAQ